ncbi:MAG: ABC transporter permease [Bacteroidales bacterium]|jgi:ABC-2 type transport system permease protein|nr:ABC transporter permease [Bacteroidales bacterium]
MTYVRKWFHDLWNIFTQELRLIGRDNGVMLIFCFAGLVYPVLYNYIYRDGVVDDMSVAVVDLSHGSYSRRYVQKFDATRECAVAYDCVSMAEAEQLMKEQKVHGILYIPSDFDARLERGEQATLGTYADMSTFLYYKNMTIASNLVMLDEMPASKLVRYEDTRLYNPNISFTMFFIYMALMMILQQVMFYGSSTLAGTMREEGRSFAQLCGGHGVGRVVLGRGSAYFLIFLFLGAYGAVLVPYLFHLPQHADWWDLMILLAFFVADIVFFSFTWSSGITKRETVLVLLLFVSPIAVFLTGFTWPTENFPLVWRLVSYVFPTTFGCRAYMTLTQTGSLSAIAPEIEAMTIQTAVYYFLSCAAIFAENRLLKRKNTVLL